MYIFKKKNYFRGLAPDLEFFNSNTFCIFYFSWLKEPWINLACMENTCNAFIDKVWQKALTQNVIYVKNQPNCRSYKRT